MQYKRFIPLAVIMLSFKVIGVHAQETIVVSGGNASGINGTVSYTVVPSIQQPYEITVVTGIEEKEIDLMLSVYPNPTSDYLTLKVSDPELSTLNFQLFNVSGQMLLSKQITANETKVLMTRYEKGTYFLKITETKPTTFKGIKTFKIIKK